MSNKLKFNEILDNLKKTSVGYRKALAEEGLPQGLPTEVEQSDFNMTLEEVVGRLEQLLEEIRGGSTEVPLDIESIDVLENPQIT